MTVDFDRIDLMRPWAYGVYLLSPYPRSIAREYGLSGEQGQSCIGWNEAFLSGTLIDPTYNPVAIWQPSD